MGAGLLVPSASHRLQLLLRPLQLSPRREPPCSHSPLQARLSSLRSASQGLPRTETVLATLARMAANSVLLRQQLPERDGNPPGPNDGHMEGHRPRQTCTQQSRVPLPSRCRPVRDKDRPGRHAAGFHLDPQPRRSFAPLHRLQAPQSKSLDEHPSLFARMNQFHWRL